MLHLASPALPAFLFFAVLSLLLFVLRRTGLRWGWVAALAVFGALGWGIVFVGHALAQTAPSTPPITVEQWYRYVCGDDGAVFKFLAHFLYPALAIAIASFAANSKTLQAVPVLGPLLNLVGGNWAKWLRIAAAQAGKSGAMIAVVLGASLALCACTAQQIVTAADAVQAACGEADHAASTAQGQLKGGALDTANGIIVYEKSVCGSADQIAKAAADPTTAAWLGAMTQQLKKLVSG